MKVGVNGAVRDISDFKTGVSGAVRPVKEVYIGVSGAIKKVWPAFPVGYQVVLDTTGAGTWTCPATGNWQIEGHGAGGAGGSYNFMNNKSGAGGGGSGEVYETQLTVDSIIQYYIGSKSKEFSSGEDTTFGNYTFKGGESASEDTRGTASGSLATDGSWPQYNSPGAGGVGNKNKPSQTYGNGGKGAKGFAENGETGKPGAIILTYMG